MREYTRLYIGGHWTEPVRPASMEVVDPSTEEVCGRVAAASAADVDLAVGAARDAFPGWASTERKDRVQLLRDILEVYTARSADLAEALTEEMGAPAALASGFQVQLAAGHLGTAIENLERFAFEERRGNVLVVREPIGVCGLITPWNWPMNQMAVKVLPALATGCTMVLKPSEQSPFTGQILAEILDAAGVPAGVFNLVQGDGPTVGAPLAAHPGVDMVSFTGSTRVGVEIARVAAPTVKRVTQELGGKSPNIVLDDGQFAEHVQAGVAGVMANSGQTCSAPTRMLVPRSRMAEAADVAGAAAGALTVGDPRGSFDLGPVVSAAQFEKVQRLIRSGIDAGARLVTGGPGRPDGLDRGYYVRPTVFADVDNDMEIAREEIFGPVLVIIGYDGIDHAVELANDTDYGLAGNVAGADLDLARSVARRIRAGWVSVNDGFDFGCPFGGYKRSGNGREWGEFGFHDYLEIKGLPGWLPDGS
jgi:aldehyde dehydrogenase (NAD+)